MENNSKAASEGSGKKPLFEIRQLKRHGGGVDVAIPVSQMDEQGWEPGQKVRVISIPKKGIRIEKI